MKQRKRLGKSKYKYISSHLVDGTEYFVIRIPILKITKYFRCDEFTERQVAIEVDKYFIQAGKSPVNILKPKESNIFFENKY